MATIDRINAESSALQLRATASKAPQNELRVAARALSLALFQEPTMLCTEAKKEGDKWIRCSDREEKRLRGTPTLPPHAERRPFGYYDPQKLCNHCRPYWYAEMAAQELDRCAVFEAQDKAAREPETGGA